MNILRKSGSLHATYSRAALVFISFSLSAVAISAPTFAVMPINPPASSSVATPVKAEVHPFWAELTPEQRIALAPLESEWSKIDTFRKKKWLQISSRFSSMKPDEQLRLQEKMRIWAKLTPDQRRHAREVYSRTKSLDAEQKSAEWQQYQQLPETEKKRLAKDIAAKKHVANLPTVPAPVVITPPKVLASPIAKPSASSPATPTLPASVEPAVPVVPAPSPIPVK